MDLEQAIWPPRLTDREEKMSKTLYLECTSGISGDMAVAALLDLGASEEVLKKAIASMKLEGCEIAISDVKKSGLVCKDFNVILDSEHDGHDHDMEYLHGHEHNHNHEHDHETHQHGEEQHSHNHQHRGLAEITDIINKGDITKGARELAVKIFTIIAQAEAKAHGESVDKVHFHEVGAVDSIVDIVAFAVCFDNLGITDVIIPDICEGRGTVRCQHGILPIPVPAVTNIAQSNNLRLSITDVEGELVTPTGAAIAAAIRTSDRLPAAFLVTASGMGAGKRTYERPSILRAMLIEAEQNGDSIYRLETDIDDCSGEILGHTMELLYKAGAREVHYSPIYMKKNRPAYELVVICEEELKDTMMNIIFHNTTTIGIRYVQMDRRILKRQAGVVTTPFGEATVKICTFNGEDRCYPEYDSVTELAASSMKSYQEMYEIIRKAYDEGKRDSAAIH